MRNTASVRILFTRFPYTSAKGGAERQTLSLMLGLRERGHTVEFWGSCPVLLEWCKANDIPSLAFNIDKPPVTKWGAISFYWRQWRMRRNLHFVFRSYYHGVDAVVMLSMTEKLLLTDLAAEQKKRVRWIEHDPVGRWLTKNPWLSRLRSTSKHATTITVSELSRKLYLSLGWQPDRLLAIPNGVAISCQSHQPCESFTLGCVARLQPEKGVDVLLCAVAAIPNVRLWIVGSGPEEASLKKLIQDLDLHDRVTLESAMDDVASVYARVDALVLPSRSNDPFGMVAAEAMLCGTPVIVTDACGIASYLTPDKDALIAKADNVTSLQAQIVALRDSEKRASIAKHGQETALKTFSVQEMVSRYEVELQRS